jgi:hypothetical protein
MDHLFLRLPIADAHEKTHPARPPIGRTAADARLADRFRGDRDLCCGATSSGLDYHRYGE